MHILLAIAAALLTAGAWGQGMKAETKEEKDARMKWWREARFGMFLHWGLYSVPAGQYGGKTTYGEWIRDEARIPLAEYEKLKDQFNPVKFDADAWVRMARDAGMKYVVITTKHHDGFNLFNSPLTDWDVGATPFKRDIMAEMAAACAKYGLKIGWYHSIMDWNHPDYLPRRPWEAQTRPEDGADFRRYVKYLRDEVSWLLTKYGPIGTMWFDGEWESTWNATDGAELYQLCRQLQPNVIVNNRVTSGRGGIEDSTSMRAGDFTTPEQYIPPTGLGDLDWETCMTMNDHWGYNSEDRNWKSGPQLVRNLVDIASKGGNYLLNVGPRADGTFPPESVDRLRQIGDWMKGNGEAIYGTTASVFEGLPWGRSTTKREGEYTTLYLLVFDWPTDGRLVVPGIGSEPVRAEVLRGGVPTVAECVRSGPDLAISVGAAAPDANVSVVRLQVKGAPIVYKPPRIRAPSDILVNSISAQVEGGSTEIKVRYTINGTDPDEKSPEVNRPILIDRTLTLKAASFHNGRRVSSIASKEFTKVAPRPATAVGNLVRGIVCDEYKGEWEALPDFRTLQPRDSFIARDVSLALKDRSEASREEGWARRFAGYVRAPEDAVYVFALTSDDGSKLWIDDELVVDNDGLHSSATKTGRIALARGPHKIVVGWFNATGGLDLSLQWAKAGEPLQPVSTTALGHVGQ